MPRTKSDATKQAELKYQADNIRQFKLNLNRKTDAELIEWLEAQKPLAGYLRQLIINDKAARS